MLLLVLVSRAIYFGSDGKNLDLSKGDLLIVIQMFEKICPKTPTLFKNMKKLDCFQQFLK